ncbi:helix-hairpin-helix domain-containing protein [Sphingobacterium sp. lm-10]|uniref:ComEA family DNA-binding protein n=1 Tax=Sphingobacterium sp. lm-10 TaxID=2944904 RepID=UPI0020224DBD|nr:helix-hairpin-helix domain-containing protein [Sphingobacterium sp. lm-10]MCL7987550.1 helix-hairpin-helix domain-containing protein [Sphingobacterium sp. lm-10]
MKRLQDFFNLTYKERNGFLVFTIFILGLVLVPSIWSLLPKDPIPEYKLQVFPSSHPNLIPENATANIPNEIQSIQPFNPNRLPSSEWAKMGLSAKQIAVIHRYEERGGTFREKGDVQKMYVIDDVLYRRIAPFIRIPSGKHERNKISRDQFVLPLSRKSVRAVYPASGVDTSVRIEVNLADTTDWKMLRGIGSVYAARIVRYRELLGGFHQLEQLREVYGLPEERLEGWLKQLYLESPRLRKIQINHWSADEMQRHPYISKKQAERVVNYRNQHGAYQSVDDMRKILVLDTDFFVKIEAYLDFQQ